MKQYNVALGPNGEFNFVVRAESEEEATEKARQCMREMAYIDAGGAYNVAHVGELEFNEYGVAVVALH